MLTLKNVSAGYGGADVIKDISLEIKSSAAIVGPNGCGKTTLLRVIAGILPCRGDIAVLGKPLRAMKRREISQSIAMLSQQPGIYFSYNVYDTVMMGRYVHIKRRVLDAPAQEDIAAVERALDAVNLTAERGRDITTLSGGQLQRVFLARALTQEPRIILLDEPTNHLDLKCQLEIIEYLKKWAQEGNRIVMGVLHDINLAMRLSEHFIVMQNGKIRACGQADEIISAGVLDEVYDMDVADYMRSVLGRWG